MDDPGWAGAWRGAVPGQVGRSGGGAPPVLVLRQVFVAFAVGLVLLGVVVVVVGLGRNDDVPLGLGYLVTAGVGLASLAASTLVRPRLDTSSESALLGSYRTRFFLRLAAGEAPLLVGVAMAFVVGGIGPYLVGLPFAAIGFARAAPTAAAIARDDEALASSGSPVSLCAALFTPT